MLQSSSTVVDVRGSVCMVSSEEQERERLCVYVSTSAWRPGPPDLKGKPQIGSRERGGERAAAMRRTLCRRSWCITENESVCVRVGVCGGVCETVRA